MLHRSATIGSERRFRCLVTDDDAGALSIQARLILFLRSKAEIAEQKETARIAAGHV